MILTRRLELQLAEMDKAEAAESQDKKPVNGDSTTSLSLDSEDEKERTISKAALTIAELSQLITMLLDTTQIFN